MKATRVQRLPELWDNMTMSPSGLETKNDCAGEGQQKLAASQSVGELHDFQSRGTVKYGN
jgi:hypothetical protein